MTSREISLLNSSFQKISPVTGQAAAWFHTRLLELDPTLRDLFQRDAADQAGALWRVFGLAAQGAQRPETLAPAARQLGFKHAGYHVKERHYDTVGEALLWTLAKSLGAEFTPEIRSAWGKTYWLLAEMIKTGARDGAAKLNRAAA